MDVVVGGALVVIASPVMLMIAAAIRATSPGPALFRQVRIGRDLVPFSIMKFRTMLVGNDDAIHRQYVSTMWATIEPASCNAPVHKLTDDPRVTPLGRFLRRTSLDELPQLFNVLRGEMSLVGPRPVLPWEAELFEPRHQARFGVKPGMTGLWQVSGRSRLTMREGAELDLQYVESLSARGDVAILARTIPAVIRAAFNGRDAS